MGKIEAFHVILAGPGDLVYMPGDRVKGFLALKLNQELKINSLDMMCTGVAHVSWTERTTSGGKSQTRTINGDQILFNQLLPVIIRKLKGNEFICAGEHTFPFEFQLPLSLPGSLEGPRYHVRYMVKAHLDIPWALDKRIETQFFIRPNLDLMMYPYLRSPIFLTDSKTPGMFGSRPINIKFEINQGGFVPGESIRFIVDMDNQTEKEITDMSVRLVQQIRKVSNTGSTNTTCLEWGTLSCPQTLKPMSSIRWEYEYQVAPTLCTSLVLHVLQISYFFEFRLKAGFFSVTKTLPLPVTLGTQPLVNTEASSYPPQMLAPLPATGSVGSEFQIYPSLPIDQPPSYYSAMKS